MVHSHDLQKQFADLVAESVPVKPPPAPAPAAASAPQQQPQQNAGAGGGTGTGGTEATLKEYVMALAAVSAVLIALLMYSSHSTPQPAP